MGSFQHDNLATLAKATCVCVLDYVSTVHSDLPWYGITKQCHCYLHNCCYRNDSDLTDELLPWITSSHTWSDKPSSWKAELTCIVIHTTYHWDQLLLWSKKQAWLPCCDCIDPDDCNNWYIYFLTTAPAWDRNWYAIHGHVIWSVANLYAGAYISERPTH